MIPTDNKDVIWKNMEKIKICVENEEDHARGLGSHHRFVSLYLM